jgi:hypothetical protein
LSKENKALIKTLDALEKGFKTKVKKHELEVERATRKAFYKQKIRELECKGKGQVKETN